MPLPRTLLLLPPLRSPSLQTQTKLWGKLKISSDVIIGLEPLPGMTPKNRRKIVKLPKVHRMEDFLSMLFVAPSRGDSEEILEAKAAMVENEQVNEARSQVLKV